MGSFASELTQPRAWESCAGGCWKPPLAILGSRTKSRGREKEEGCSQRTCFELDPPRQRSHVVIQGTPARLAGRQGGPGTPPTLLSSFKSHPAHWHALSTKPDFQTTQALPISPLIPRDKPRPYGLKCNESTNQDEHRESRAHEGRPGREGRSAEGAKEDGVREKGRRGWACGRHWPAQRGWLHRRWGKQGVCSPHN